MSDKKECNAWIKFIKTFNRYLNIDKRLPKKERDAILLETCNFRYVSRSLILSCFIYYLFTSRFRRGDTVLGHIYYFDNRYLKIHKRLLKKNVMLLYQ